MKKYKNLSGKDIGFIIDGKTYDFQNGQIVSIPEGLKERVDYLISKIIPEEEIKPVIPIIKTVITTPIIEKPVTPVVVVAKVKKKSVKKK
jgi:hypothetical protein